MIESNPEKNTRIASKLMEAPTLQNFSIFLNIDAPFVKKAVQSSVPQSVNSL